MTSKTHFAMPVGLPISTTDAVTHFAALRSQMEAEIGTDSLVHVWAANNPSYSSVHAMARGMLFFLPAGGVDTLGRTVAEPSIFLRVWVSDYIQLHHLVGEPAPKFIWYRNIDVAEVRSALLTLINADPRLAAQATTVLAQVMAGQSKLLVKAGAAIGRGAIDTASSSSTRNGKRLIKISFEDEMGGVMSPQQSLGYWSTAGGPFVEEHPLLDVMGASCFPSISPIEGRIWVRLNLPAQVVSTMNRVSLGGVLAQDLRKHSSGGSIFIRVPPHTAGAVDIDVEQSPGVFQRYTGALRYVEDFGNTVRAVAASQTVTLGLLEDCLNQLSPTDPIPDTEVAVIEGLGDLLGSAASEILATRAIATGGSLLDPSLNAIIADVQSQNAARTQAVLRKIGMIPVQGPASIANISMGPGFFSQARSLMDANRGLVVATDGDVRIVCVDASFYRFRVLDRPPLKAMSEAMSDLVTSNPDVRAVVNGQYFIHPDGKEGYYYVVHPSLPLGGKCIPFGNFVADGTVVNGYALAGVWASLANVMKGFGQLQGRGQAAYVLADALPDAQALPGPFKDAMSVKAIVKNGKFVYCYPPGVNGRNFWGIHRSTNTAFFLGGVFDFVEVQELLVTMGVDDAVVADGGTSLMMMVDGTWVYNYAKGIDWPAGSYHPRPLAPKDYSNPIAAYFQLESLRGVNGVANVTTETTDPNWSQSVSIEGLTARIVLGDAGAGHPAGLQVVFDSLGVEIGGVVRNIANALGISLPLTLRTASSDATTVSRRFDMSPTPGNVLAQLQLKPTATTDGRLVGRFEARTAQGLVVLNISMPLATAP